MTRRELAAAGLDALAAFALSRAVVLLTLELTGSRGRYLEGWDGAYYAAIAGYGYSTALISPVLSARTPAFFPLLPLAERVIAVVGISQPLAGALFSSACTLAALVVLGLLTAERFDRRTARLAVYALCLFPFSFVLSTGYTEGPFLLLSLLAYGAVLRRRSASAAVASFLAGLSRPPGILLAPAFAWEAYRHPERRRAALAGAAGALLAPLVFSAYLWHVRGDFLASLHAQERGWHRQTSVLRGLPMLARYTLRAVTTPHGTRLVYLIGVPLCVAGLVVLYRRGVRDGPFVLALGALVLPLATGSADSLPRFAMATFPYAWAAGIALDRVSRRVRLAALAGSGVALALTVVVTYHSLRLPP
jgi:hypothetical protein